MTRYQLDQQPWDEEAFDESHTFARLFTGVSLAATIFYLFLGAVMRFLVMDDGGFGNLDAVAYRIFFGILLLNGGVMTYLILVYFPDKMKARAQEEEDPDNLPTLARTFHLIRVAMTNSIAVAGLVLFMVSGKFIPLFLFSFAALALQIFLFPSRSHWERTLSSLQRR